MHWAGRRGHWRTLEALAASGADVDPVCNKGNTPLHDAALNGKLLAVGALIGLGASTSKKNKDGKTPQDLLGTTSADRVFLMVMAAGNQTGDMESWFSLPCFAPQCWCQAGRRGRWPPLLLFISRELKRMFFLKSLNVLCRVH